ncbi:MAG: cytochrome c3 family protein, partial [Bacteroidia bacterium]|nr:cytochrome c3 family protein [Bacteroidia bacterium]
MYRLSSIILILFSFIQVHGQSPHGDLFKLDCAACHSSIGWVVELDSLKYDHETSGFKLEGKHTSVDCKACHSTLKFEEASNQCSSCHTDIHESSVGNDCNRCHTTQNWIVDNIPQIHEEGGFALVGAHGGLSCTDCHTSNNELRFDPIGNDCSSCHMDDYMSAKNPDHNAGGFSTNCVECHDPISQNWDSDNFKHDFFPLTAGHDIQDCKECHVTNNYSETSSLCNSCHMQDYNSAANPGHLAANISTTCNDCHNTSAWNPATFD